MNRDWRVTSVGFGLLGRLGLILLLLLASAAPAAAAINLLTSASAAGTNIGSGSNWLQVNVNTPGNSTVVVAVAIKNVAVAPGSVTDSGGSLYVLLADQIVNVTYARVQLWSTVAAGAKNSTWVRVNTCCTGTDMVAAVASYSGVVSLGNPVFKGFTGLSTTATTSVTTQDANNWVVSAMATAGGATPGSSAGRLREKAVTTNATIGGALMDDWSATYPVAVSNTMTVSPAQYTAMAAVELRTAPGIYNIGTSTGQNSGQCNAGTAVAGGIDLIGKVNVVTVSFAASGSSVTNVTESIPGSAYTKKAVITGGATTKIEIWAAPVSTAASGSVLVNVSSGNPKTACALATYVGVAGFGSTTGTSGTTSNPSTAALTTQDPNNVVVGGFAWTGTALNACPSPNTFRASILGTGTVVGVCDRTSTTTGPLTTQATHVSGQWAAAALELRASRATWNYTTSGATMAAPALDPWANLVVQGSNDTDLHGMGETDGAQAFAPVSTGGAIQARPTVIPGGYRTPAPPGADPTENISYVGAQDGYAYAIKASVSAGTAQQVWKTSTQLGTTLQGGTAVWLQTLGSFQGGFTNSDVVFVGTSNTGNTSSNKVYALRADTGATVWTFAPGTMDVISSTPYVDYAKNAVWVTSRSAGGTGQPSVWKLNAATGAPYAGGVDNQDRWYLGDIDASPIPSSDGQYIYVGTTTATPTLNAICVNGPPVNPLCSTAGQVLTHNPASGSGPINGMPWPLSWNPVGAATPDTIIFSRNATVHSVKFDGSNFLSCPANCWTTTLTGAPTTVSAPVDDGGNYLYVGDNKSQVHQLCVNGGAEKGQVSVNAATTTVGQPTFNWDVNRIHVGATDGRIYTFAVPLVAASCP